MMPRKFRMKGATQRSATLTVELMVAMAIVVAVLLPFVSAFDLLHKSIRASYQRAVAMEIIDGEMEILAAGEWREFKTGAQEYSLRGQSATNLPPGKAMFTITGNHLRLEWLPERHDSGGKIVREATAK